MPNEAKLQPVAQQLCGAPSDPQGSRPGSTCTWGKGHLSPVHHDAGYLWVDPAEFPAFAAEKELREKAEAEWERHTQDAEASRAAFKAAQELIRMNNEAMAKEYAGGNYGSGLNATKDLSDESYSAAIRDAESAILAKMEEVKS